MPKRKGLGKEVTKSLEILDDLHAGLDKFEKAPLKEGFDVNGALDDAIARMVNESKDEASKLAHKIEDLRNKLSKIKPPTSSRFGPARTAAVIDNFLKRI